jgi:hypothetical protein
MWSRFSKRSTDVHPRAAHTEVNLIPMDAIALRKSACVGLLVVIVALFSEPGAAAQQSDADLAAAAQNPVAATYSLPFQNNIFGGAGPTHNAVGNALNIQPVLPFTFGDWNVISRTITPLIYVPGLVPGLSDNAGVPAGTGSVFGLGSLIAAEKSSVSFFV